MRNDNGLFVNDLPNGSVECVGYIFNFSGHGAYDPNGRLAEEYTQEQLDTHNRLLAEAEWNALIKNGSGCLYISKTDSGYIVSDWVGIHKIPVQYTKSSRHPVPNAWERVQRRDAWLTIEGALWHGVNIGDNQVIRLRRSKQR